MMLKQIFLLSKLFPAFTISTLESTSPFETSTTHEHRSVLTQELQTSDLWLTTYQLDGYEHFTHLFFAFEQSPGLFNFEHWHFPLFATRD